MKFISRNPSNDYKFIKHNGLKIYINAEDMTAETKLKARELCNERSFNYKTFSKVYYLRGRRNKAHFGKVLLGGLEAGKRLPKELWEVIHCLTFWNQEGIECHRMNGKEDESYEDFILTAMACDCRVFVEPCSDMFITGRGGNHIWIADKKSGERILVFHL